jgi:hypothetical protein
MTNAIAAHASPVSTVLTQAVAQIAQRLELTNKELGLIIGISQPSASRLLRGHYFLPEGSKEWEMSALLVRLYRGLYSIVGNSDELARTWLNSENTAFAGQMPHRAIQRVDGLVFACEYVDAHRAPL